MEVLNTKEQEESPQPAAEGKNEDTYNDSNHVPLAGVNEAARSEAAAGIPNLESVEKATKENTDLVNLDSAAAKVVITDDDKTRFIDAVLRGCRYTAYAYLYGGKVRVKFRSRTLNETEAIMAYVHREGILGNIVTRADLSDNMMAALFVAQVEEVGDLSYPEMKQPYKFVDTPSGVENPGWIGELEMWKSKPEHLTAALGNALIEFEAKYWKMIGESKNENFWNPGRSTGE